MKSIDVSINPVYLPRLNSKQPIQIFYGGSSSGKSFFLAQRIVLRNMGGTNFLIVRQSATSMKRSCFNEIMKAIGDMNLTKYYHVNATDMIITNLTNMKQILFCGLSDPERIKSISPKNGVLEEIFIEEATETTYHGYKQLTKRLRGVSDKPKIITFAFNPILRSHWIYKEFFSDCWDDNTTVYEDDYKLILKTTYRDNLHLTKDDIKLLEAEKDPYYIDVYLNGNWGILGHVIFRKWRVEDLSSKISQFDRIYIGCDFGFASDPNALIKVHLDKKRKKIYVFDEWYQAGMSDDELLRVCRNFVGAQYVTCDSSEPKTINYLANSGIKAVGAVKGPDSINRGIRWLQDFEIIIDIRCQNFKNEIESYHWIEDKNGNAMARPADLNNHLIDALRYALCDEILAAEVQVGHRI